MTQAEFFKKLKKYRGKFHLSEWGCVRDNQDRCPIEVIANTKDNDIVNACRVVGLDKETASNIVASADGWCESERATRYRITVLKKLRQHILEIVGLKETTVKRFI